MQKDVLWKAGLLATIIFILGIALSVWLGNSRVDLLRQRLNELDTYWNDVRLQGQYLDVLGKPENCNSYLEANLDFNYNIYQEGLKIEQIESINRFSESTIFEKQRYALLQLQFWINSIKIKQTCDFNYYNLVYFYSHNDLSKEQEQMVQSSVLTDLKDKCGDKVMLIPIPGDLDLTSISLIIDIYGIKNLPSILIDQNVVLSGLQSKENLEKYIKC